jgi:hypothetical protein
MKNGRDLDNIAKILAAPGWCRARTASRSGASMLGVIGEGTGGVQIVYDPAFSVGSQRVLFSVAKYTSQIFHRSYDIAADDQRFVMIRQDQPNRGDVILVQNFFEELKAKVGN